ncbi:site-specific integrase [Bacillus atrophaeus]|nr:site-specific integrase [Bacillus atrophaeus]
MEHLRKEDMKWKMIVTLAITTGMRRGEILALEWEHVDLEKGKIYVKQSLTYTKEHGHIFKDPKTRNSNRTISLSPSVTEQLKRYKQMKNREKLCPGENEKAGSVFYYSALILANPCTYQALLLGGTKRLKNMNYLK